MLKLAEEILCDHRKHGSQVFLFTSALSQEGVTYVTSRLVDMLSHIFPEGVFYFNDDKSADEAFIKNESNIRDDFFRNLRESYKLIIVDASGLMKHGHPLHLFDHCDAAVVVVRAGSTDRGLVKESLQKIRRHGLRVAGVVLNGARQIIPEKLYRLIR